MFFETAKKELATEKTSIIKNRRAIIDFGEDVRRAQQSVRTPKYVFASIRQSLSRAAEAMIIQEKPRRVHEKISYGKDIFLKLSKQMTRCT